MGNDFVEQAFAEIDEMERNEILANEKVRALISQKSSRVSEKVYGNVTLRFRTSITKKLRKRLMKAKDSLQNDEKMDKFLYETLSLLCIDAPWNHWQTWAVYDDAQSEDGIGALEIFTDLMTEVKRLTEDVRTFR